MENRFYNIKDYCKDGNTITHVIELNNKHSIYKGHFPGQPVLPGVCTLKIIKECLSDSLKEDIEFTKIKECKFLSPIIPSINEYYRIESSINDRKLNCNIYNNDKVILKLKAVV